MPAAGTSSPESEAGPPRTAPLTLSKKIFGAALALALLALVRGRIPEIFSRPFFPRLASANPWLVALGFLLNILAFGVRAFRFNLLLLPADRIPVATAWSLSGATTFLLQVMPFRSGEIGSWASIRAALGASWARSGAVLALVKLLDTATLLLAGLAGAAWLLFAHGTHVLGVGVAALVLLGAGLLLALPLAGGRLLASLVPRLPEEQPPSRHRTRGGRGTFRRAAGAGLLRDGHRRRRRHSSLSMSRRSGSPRGGWGFRSIRRRFSSPSSRRSRRPRSCRRPRARSAPTNRASPRLRPWTASRSRRAPSSAASCTFSRRSRRGPSAFRSFSGD